MTEPGANEEAASGGGLRDVLENLPIAAIWVDEDDLYLNHAAAVVCGRQAGGLRTIMRHRSNMIEGTFSILPGQEGGTVVSCAVPQADQEAIPGN